MSRYTTSFHCLVTLRDDLLRAEEQTRFDAQLAKDRARILASDCNVALKVVTRQRMNGANVVYAPIAD